MKPTLGLIGLLLAICALADERYVDDIYYSPTLVQNDAQGQTITPYYDTKQIKELVFQDTVYINSSDTIEGDVPFSGSYQSKQ